MMMDRKMAGLCLAGLCCAASAAWAGETEETADLSGSSRVHVLEVVQGARHNHSKYILQWRTVNDPRLGKQPDWNKLDQLHKGLSQEQTYTLVGEPWHRGNSYLTEWNYLYRYVFSGHMQQCQLKLVFDQKTGLLDTLFWEPVGGALCRAD